ncbi:MAG: alternative ribosome rescue aminoacyl-tRNA hydrolase ArfB [Pseudomonadota bacterium]
MRITDDLSIDDSLLTERFVRASGPGGQHVNTTASAVQLRFDLAASALPGPVKARLVKLAGARLSREGVIIIQADSSRSQERNRAEARERLRGLIARALVAPKPRKKTRPSLSSIRKAKTAKARRGQVKALRGRPKGED